MNHIPSFDQFLNESSHKWYDLNFKSHKDHNPYYDILEGHLDRNTMITYSICVKGSDLGKESMEYYTGPNYKPESLSARSSSRNYSPDKIPAKYQNLWNELRVIYQNEYRGGKSTNESFEDPMNEAFGFSKVASELVQTIKEMDRTYTPKNGLQSMTAKRDKYNENRIVITREFDEITLDIIGVKSW